MTGRRRERPPDPVLVAHYRAAYGTGAQARTWLLGIAERWWQAGTWRPYVGDHPGHWNHGPDDRGHTDDCCMADEDATDHPARAEERRSPTRDTAEAARRQQEGRAGRSQRRRVRAR